MRAIIILLTIGMISCYPVVPENTDEPVIINQNKEINELTDEEIQTILLYQLLEEELETGTIAHGELIHTFKIELK